MRQKIQSQDSTPSSGDSIIQWQTLPIYMVFLLMGVADAMGPLSAAVRDNFKLSAFMAALVPFSCLIAFAVVSVPAGLLAARIGKKNVLLLGLVLNTVAVAVPAFISPGYVVLLSCIFLLGIGTTLLQVAGNPIMRDVSAAGDYSRNLALAQGIKGIGSTTMTALATAGVSLAFLPMLKTMGWRGVFPIFFVLMALALFFVIILKVKETKAAAPPSVGSSLALLAEPVFALAVLGIGLYVGAEICMSTFLKPTLMGFGCTENFAAWAGPVAFLGFLTVGRLVAGSLKVSPRALFRLSTVLGLIGAGLMIAGIKELAILGAVVGGLGFANIWPMLFSITVEEKPECANELSGLMCMAIGGGALIPPLMGKFVDLGFKNTAFMVPAACFVYLLLLSLRGASKRVKGMEAVAVNKAAGV